MKDVHGEMCEARFYARNSTETDGHILIQLIFEDDDATLSTEWLDDAIDVLERARRELKRTADKDACGYVFRKSL